ncbi:MAG: TylF/MycF/NovP-related O-methyltransferase [Cyanobacterium sp.]
MNSNQPKIFETDWLASQPIFYNEKTGKVSHNINNVIDFVNFEFHPEGFNNYLDFGYSILEQTPIKDVKFLRHSCRLTFDEKGKIKIEYLEDIAETWIGKTSHEDDVLHLLHTAIRNWEKSVEGEIILPTSGGYDSRILTYFIENKSRIRSFTYGLSQNQSESFEVVHARKLSEIFGTKWEQIPLGYFHQYFDEWDKLFGISTHAHGMYHIEFYNQIMPKIAGGNPFLSGIIGDAWAGSVNIDNLYSPEDLQKLGYTHGLNSNSEYSNFKGKNSIIEYFYEQNIESLKIPSYRIIQAMRFKITLLSYLFIVPKQFGFKVWSPFLDPEIALSMLTLPPSRRKDRIWQRELFQKNGLDLESMNLQRSTQNNLNYQAMCKMPVKPLDVKLLAEVVNPQYVHSINNYLQEKHLGAYCAYLTLKPIENAIKKRQELNMSQSSTFISYQQNRSKPLIQINSFRVQHWKLTTPVAFFIFNRPDTTQKVFNTIREAKPPKLLVVADGARRDKQGEVELCQQTRAIIDQVDWDCEILTNYSDVNLGCRQRISSGLDWVFEQVEEAIILEDDCLPHPTFFRYCQELLEKYRDDERIMFISGDNFQFGRNKTEYSYYFSRYNHCWGWASWRRAWAKYDNSMKTWQEVKEKNLLASVFSDSQAIDYWTNIFDSVYQGKINSWAYIFQLTEFINNGLTILPNENLISNIGFDVDATHTKGNSTQANMATSEMIFPLKHPPYVIRNVETDDFTEQTIFSGARNTTQLTNEITTIIDAINNKNDISALNLANSLKNNNINIDYGKAIALARTGQTSQAVESLNSLLAVHPNHKKAKLLLTELSDNNLNNLIKQADNALKMGYTENSFKILNHIKSLKIPTENIDYLRAICFLKMNSPGAIRNARESLLEELRLFPHNQQAQELLNEINGKYPNIDPQASQDQEFRALMAVIRPYTMLTEPRLYSLYTLTKRICQENIEGNFVECGVAGGGSTALMASVIKRYSKIPRLIYACDSFSGMPKPTAEDTQNGMDAEATGWGTGTCAAPEDSVKEVCQKLGVSNLLVTVKGYFQDTLPENREKMGNIAFLHMDGDWYDSTKAILNNLYDNVVDNGLIQIDDYGAWEGCRQAISEYQTTHNLKFYLNQIDNTGYWFSKVEVSQLENISNPKITKKFLNLGCGNHFNPNWTNVDFTSTGEGVIAHNLRQGIPFPDRTFEVVYHSHILEHFPKNEAQSFLQECYRVLESQGIIRVVIPDLEQIARLYLQSLENALQGSEEATNNYDWIMLEMYDQVVRNESGGEMKKYLAQNPLPNEQFIIERLGVEGEQMINQLRGKNFSNSALNPTQIGYFRESGEIHQWMYDRFSLSRLLAKVGFIDIKICQANESRIPNFNSYYLDVLPDGRVRKSDSLFMEGIKS